MAKKRILITMVILGLVVLPLALLTSTKIVCAEENVNLEPMELDGTKWKVEMVYVTKKGKKDVSRDILIFSDNKFISKNFEKKKYSPTNYSMTLEEDGTTKFGTMQIKDKETLFWKGVVKGHTIDGSVHTQFSSESSRTTYFTGKLISGVLKSKSKTNPKPPAPVVTQEIPKQPVVDTPPIQAQLEVSVVPPEEGSSLDNK